MQKEKMESQNTNGSLIEIYWRNYEYNLSEKGGRIMIILNQLSNGSCDLGEIHKLIIISRLKLGVKILKRKSYNSIFSYIKDLNKIILITSRYGKREVYWGPNGYKRITTTMNPKKEEWEYGRKIIEIISEHSKLIEGNDVAVGIRKALEERKLMLNNRLV